MNLGLVQYDPEARTLAIQSAEGQVYRLVGTKPYKLKTGKEVPNLVWRSMDPETGEFFEWSTPTTFDPSRMNRRAPTRSQRGKKVEMLHREPGLKGHGGE